MEVTDARNQRMKRAVDCSLKKSYLPKDLQDQQTPWAWYVRVGHPGCAHSALQSRMAALQDQDGVHAGISHRVLSGKLAGCKLLLLGADARRSGRSCCTVLFQVLRTLKCSGSKFPALCTMVSSRTCWYETCLLLQDMWARVQIENAEKAQLGTGKAYDRQLP